MKKGLVTGMFFCFFALSCSSVKSTIQPEVKNNQLVWRYYGNAESVVLKGDFNNKKDQEIPLKEIQPGVWETATIVPHSGMYLYNYIVDSQRITDPLNWVIDGWQSKYIIKKGEINLKPLDKFLIFSSNRICFFYSPTIGNAEIIGDYNKVSGWLAEMETTFGFKLSDYKQNIKIILFKDKNEQKSLTGSSANSSRPDAGQVYFGGDITTSHEFLHVIDSLVYKKGELDLSIFLSEGFATYFSHIIGYTNSNDTDFYRMMRTALDNALLVPLRDLLDRNKFINTMSFPDGYVGFYSYREAGTFIGYLWENFGKEKFFRLMQSKSYTVQDVEKDLKSIYGLTIGEAENGWKEYLMKFPPQEIHPGEADLIRNKTGEMSLLKSIKHPGLIEDTELRNALANAEIVYIIKQKSEYGNFFIAGIKYKNTTIEVNLNNNSGETANLKDGWYYTVSLSPADALKEIKKKFEWDKK